MKRKTPAAEIEKLRHKIQRFNDYSNSFKRDGNLKEGQDPYRNQDTSFYKMFFDTQGYLTDAAKAFLNEYVKWPGINPMSAAVKMLIADEFARNTSGNYSTIYLWR